MITFVTCLEERGKCLASAGWGVVERKLQGTD
jgi:hypothetical protein